MEYISFELKKMWSQKVFLMVTLLSLVMVILSIQTIKSPNFFNPTNSMDYSTASVGDRNDIHNYGMGLMNSSSDNLSSLEKEFLKVFESYINESSQIPQYELGLGESIIKSDSEYYQAVMRSNLAYTQLLTEFHFEATPSELDNLQFELNDVQYKLDNNMSFENGYLGTFTASIVFRYGMEILYGFVPMLLMLLIFAQSVSDEVETNTMNFLLTKPKKKRHILIGKFFAYLIVLLGYIVLSVTFVLLYFSVFGDGIGHFDYPLRLFGQPSQLILLWQYMLIVLGYFILITSVFVLLSYWLGLIIKNKFITTLLVILMLFMGFILTDSLSELHLWYNPFYILNYRIYVLGNLSFFQGRIDGGITTFGHFTKGFMILGILIIAFMIASLVGLNNLN